MARPTDSEEAMYREALAVARDLCNLSNIDSQIKASVVWCEKKRCSFAGACETVLVPEFRAEIIPIRGD